MTGFGHTAYLALGSNLGDPVAQLSRALQAIAAFPHTALHRASSLYQSPAWQPVSPQPDYLNAVVQVATALTPHELWQHTSALELMQGRQRGERNAARTLDIDVLLYDDVVLVTNDLILPHPRMHERAFVLMPLVEIAPHTEITGRGPAASLLSRISTDQMTKIGNNAVWNSMICATSLSKAP